MSHWVDLEPELFVELLRSGKLESRQIIDVREGMEWDYYHLEQSLLIPMNTIPDRLNELASDKPLYIICAHGVRSAAVCNYLQEKGYGSLHNVAGGMASVASIYDGFQYD
ncbi:rhodanese-like domain-containing protein [Paenibacillus oenotherae]|uniref:Rhodanese-like domain-containing protein n=1 Tax=Paenibacillus oenotherae TaxID=1435645 RepID=A0ABS7D0X4_9BACL|nr:rhodanese-like domain-containing protein [Paenibacillus oenotherae]MBW7473484.1 rhodanese-like domain-containing protein [Paenibacillus oenotherae]